MVLKQWTNAVIGVIDKKLERFDPKWQAANGKGGLRSRYEDKTGIARHREWRGVKDTFVDYTAWLNNLLAMANGGLRPGADPQGLLGVPLDGLLSGHLRLY